MLLADRHEAGRLLAARLTELGVRAPVVLALPRGGVPVGFEIARALAAPLDLVLVRKIGAPGQEELAVGAVAEGEPPAIVIDDELCATLRVPAEYLERARFAALAEIARRRQAYLGGRRPIDLAGRDAIVVDDGVATGATVMAALRAARHRSLTRLVIAVPVAPAVALARLRDEADEAVCLASPPSFSSVGQFYRAFLQITDGEVVALLLQARAQASSATP